MYVCMQRPLRAPRRSLSLSLSLYLSLYADCALGWREKEPWAHLPPYHSPQRIKTAFRTEVAVQTSRKAVRENPTAKNSCTGRMLYVGLNFTVIVQPSETVQSPLWGASLVVCNSACGEALGFNWIYGWNPMYVCGGT